MLDPVLFLEGELPNDTSGRTQHERARRNFHPHGNECVCADHAPRANLRPIKNDRAHADEGLVVDGAGVDNGAVPDCHTLAENDRKIIGEVKDGVILNVRLRSHDNAVDIAAQDRAEPNARFFAQGDLAYHSGRWNDEGGGMKTRSKP